jgi:hypothetical protein
MTYSKFSDRVALMTACGLGEVEVYPTQAAGNTRLVAVVRLRTSPFEAKGLAEAFVDLAVKVDGHLMVTSLGASGQVEMKVFALDHEQEKAEVAPDA